MQIEGLVRSLKHLRMQEMRLITCGDTNAFHLLRRTQQSDLARMLRPLRELSIGVPQDECHWPDTHFFARADEPKWAHQLVVAFGRLGIDFPRCYDVILTNLQVERRGQLCTPASDHDLVWALVHD